MLLTNAFDSLVFLRRYRRTPTAFLYKSWQISSPLSHGLKNRSDMSYLRKFRILVIYFSENRNLLILSVIKIYKQMIFFTLRRGPEWIRWPHAHRWGIQDPDFPVQQCLHPESTTGLPPRRGTVHECRHCRGEPSVHQGPRMWRSVRMLRGKLHIGHLKSESLWLKQYLQWNFLLYCRNPDFFCYKNLYFFQIGRCSTTWRKSDPLPVLINRRVLTLGVKMPPWLTKTMIVIHLNPEMPLNMARDFVAKLHHHAPLYNERSQGYTSVWWRL